ncbi:MAG: hypothetical protein SangKO_095630 [Sandaracinaceae bacterium]
MTLRVYYPCPVRARGEVRWLLWHRSEGDEPDGVVVEPVERQLLWFESEDAVQGFAEERGLDFVSVANPVRDLDLLCQIQVPLEESPPFFAAAMGVFCLWEDAARSVRPSFAADDDCEEMDWGRNVSWKLSYEGEGTLAEVTGPDVGLYEQLLRRAVDELREMVANAVPPATPRSVQ